MPNSEPSQADPEAGQEIDIPRRPSAEAEREETFPDLQREHQRHRNMGLRDDNRLKLSYFSVTRKLTRRWIQFIMAASALQFGARLFNRGFEAAEFIALITTTTATLVAFWAIVGAYLFPKRKD